MPGTQHVPRARGPRPEPPRVVPETDSLDEVRDASRHCQACPLWAQATQTVFGEGPAPARIMLVGEQPGDQEDLQGHPFVGPAGRLLDRALGDAGIDREQVYVTNAVKHFKWEPRGKRRLHKKPGELEIVACHQWLERELELVAPELVVAMGATAARALMGKATPIEANRGRVLPYVGGGHILITVHPSYLLRVPDPLRVEEYGRFVRDLSLVVSFMGRAARR